MSKKRHSRRPAGERGGSWRRPGHRHGCDRRRRPRILVFASRTLEPEDPTEAVIEDEVDLLDLVERLEALFARSEGST